MWTDTLLTGLALAISHFGAFVSGAVAGCAVLVTAIHVFRLWPQRAQARGYVPMNPAVKTPTPEERAAAFEAAWVNPLLDIAEDGTQLRGPVKRVAARPLSGSSASHFQLPTEAGRVVGQPKSGSKT